jgi:hypothetical protein
MEMLAKIGKADSSLAENQGRVVFVNTAQRARINFFMRRSTTGTYYTGVRHLRPGCAYICMCNLEDIVSVQFTVYTEPMPGWEYTLDNYQVDFEGELCRHSKLVRRKLYAKGRCHHFRYINTPRIMCTPGT